ncbi:hypothetical protein B0H13DRAFT_2532883 [Mycena leptocephala]|nr:hypothetical protein B0H13DRAFT_2532883 [Mycena leptocephala]
MFRSLIFFAITSSAFAAPTRSSTCPPRDDNGGALIEEIAEKNGQFLDCRYSKAGLCTYFAIQGSFSSGSSVCPDSAIASSSGSNSGGSEPSSSAAKCVAKDDAGSALKSSNIGSDGFVSCQYQAAGTCEVDNFPPGQAPVQTPSRLGLVFLQRHLRELSPPSSDVPTSLTITSGSSALAQCVATDDAGSLLQSSGITADGFVSCQYQTAGTCVYFSPGGQFSSGSSTCPDGITPAGNSSLGTTTGSSANSDLAQCVATDDAGSTLQSSANTTDGFVSCQYQAAGTCVYFSPGGQFSSGGSICPDSITPASNPSSSDTSTGSGSANSATSSLAQCVAEDDAGSALQSSGTTDDGFVTCKYQTAGSCEYFTPGGQFSAGSSTCPDSITPANSSPASASSIGSFLADSSSSNSSANKPAGGMSSVVIALLAMNAILVVGVLVSGAVWVRGRRPSKRSSSLKGLYAKVDASRETTVPLTHGAAPAYYSDGKPRSVFEDDS